CRSARPRGSIRRATTTCASARARVLPVNRCSAWRKRSRDKRISASYGRSAEAMPDLLASRYRGVMPHCFEQHPDNQQHSLPRSHVASWQKMVLFIQAPRKAVGRNACDPSESRHRESAVDVDNVSGGVREVAAHEGCNYAADVV